MHKDCLKHFDTSTTKKEKIVVTPPLSLSFTGEVLQWHNAIGWLNLSRLFSLRARTNKIHRRSSRLLLATVLHKVELLFDLSMHEAIVTLAPHHNGACAWGSLPCCVVWRSLWDVRQSSKRACLAWTLVVCRNVRPRVSSRSFLVGRNCVHDTVARCVSTFLRLLAYVCERHPLECDFLWPVSYLGSSNSWL